MYKTTIIIILLLSVQSVEAVSTKCNPTPTAREYQYQAIDYANKFVHFLAIQRLTCALEMDTNNASLYLERGNEYGFIGEYEAALDDLNLAFKFDPKRKYILLGLGIIYSEKQDYEKAIEYKNRYIALMVGEQIIPYVYLSLASDYTTLGKQQEALVAFDEYIDLAPDDPIGYAEKGFALKAFGENDLGEESLRKARFIDRDAGKQYIFGAQNAFVRSDVQTASVLLDKAILLSPHLSAGYVERAFLYLWQNKVDLAHKDCVTVRHNDPSSEYAYLCNSIISIVNNEWEESLQWIDQAIELDSENPALYSMRVYIYLFLRNYDAALADLDITIKLHPYYPLAHFWRGVVYEFKNEYLRAVKSYEYSLELQGGSDRNPFLADYINQLRQSKHTKSLLAPAYSSSELASLMLQYPIFAVQPETQQGII